MKLPCAIFSIFLAVHGLGMARDRPTIFHSEQLQVDLPDGWGESKQNQQGSDSVGGWESSDRKTSFYVLRLRLGNQGIEMRTALENTIERFDQNEYWQIEKVGSYRDITLNGLPASYVQVDLKLKVGERKVPFVFHFAMVGAADSFFLLQGSTMKPVWKPREDEIFRMMKSFKVLKED